GGLYKQPEQGAPNAAPEERPVYTRRLKGCGKVYRPLRAEPKPGEHVAEKEHGQCAENSRDEADRHPLCNGRMTLHRADVLFLFCYVCFHHVQSLSSHIQFPFISVCYVQK